MPHQRDRGASRRLVAVPFTDLVRDLTDDDRLFVPADPDDPMATACLNFGFAEDGYAIGYRRAAERLVEHVVQSHEDQDTLVYPVVFCYRQYIELRTKSLLVQSSRLLGRSDPDPRLLTRHELTPIWEALEPLLVEVFSDGRGQYGHIGRCVAEFADLDRRSFTFRYPTTTGGEPSLPAGLFHISLTNLRAVMDKVADALEALDTGVSTYLDQQAEYRSYYAEEFRPEW